tara:strand:+ start:1505 stop:1801 length:297 start_codon:yes stop_codon:yes gene_type:complete
MKMSSEAQNRINDFEKAASLTENLIEKFCEEELRFDAAMGGALTVMLQSLLRGSSDQTQALGVIGSAMSIAVSSNMSGVETPNEEILESILMDEGSLH